MPWWKPLNNTQFQEVCQLQRTSLVQVIGTARTYRNCCFTENQFLVWRKLSEMAQERFRILVQETQQEVYNALEEILANGTEDQIWEGTDKNRLLFEVGQILSPTWFETVLKSHGTYRLKRVRNHDTQYTKVHWHGKEIVCLTQAAWQKLATIPEEAAEKGTSNLPGTLNLVNQALVRSGLFATEIKECQRGFLCSTKKKYVLMATQTQLPSITNYPDGIEPL